MITLNMLSQRAKLLICCFVLTAYCNIPVISVSVCVGYHLKTTHLYGMHINSPLYCRGTAGQAINVATKTLGRHIMKFQCIKNQATIEPEPACKFLEENPHETQVTTSQCAETEWLPRH